MSVARHLVRSTLPRVAPMAFSLLARPNVSTRFARSFTTATATAVLDVPAEPETKSAEQVHNEFHQHLPEIIKREEFLAIRRKLETDAREQISSEDYYAICKDVGVEHDEAKDLLKSFSQAGIVFNLSTSKDPLISDVIFLKPQRITNLIHAAFSVNKLFTGVKSVEEYGKLRAEFEELSKIKRDLDAKAYASGNRWIMAAGIYMIVQCGVLARLTWWEFSWDIMEPITYFISFSTGIVGWMYFAMQKQEYTYENLRDGITTKRRAKLYQKHGFDLERYLFLKDIFRV
eukprot:TRINITY_DN10795_c0_g1_i1.p1 TRINITY_DN10795_c0_g1~~TRINITY_DN10795_c0_g1_i1.p1  ORF type:complete len:288 (+),score=135.29 TRINITY_DN10795_c0_g1_i1:57-920(+)